MFKIILSTDFKLRSPMVRTKIEWFQRLQGYKNRIDRQRQF